MGHEDSPSRWLCAVGMCWDCWCLIFLLGFVFPSRPLGGSPESASAGRCRVSSGLGSAPGPHWGSAQGLVLWCGAQVLPAEVVRGGSACWALGFVFVFLLPHTSSPAFCAVVLFERCWCFALGWASFFFPSLWFWGVLFFLSPTPHKQTQLLAVGLMPALRVCWGVSAIRAALPSDPGLQPAETPPYLRTRSCPRQARREGCYWVFQGRAWCRASRDARAAC